MADAVVVLVVVIHIVHVAFDSVAANVGVVAAADVVVVATAVSVLGRTTVLWCS